MFADVSLVGFPFLLGIAALTVVVVVVAIRYRHRMRWFGAVGIWILVVVLVLGNAAGWVNRHFDYIPTLDDLFGRTARDEASKADLAKQSTVPSRGKVVTLPIPATTSGFSPRDALVYFPPAWFAKPKPELPVILLLAGTPGATDNWTQGGLADVTSDAYAAQHGGKAPILVMADDNGSDTADTECVGKAEAYLAVDVPRYVTKHFNTATEPERWAVGGLSEGGMCGLMLALRHPDTFRTFIDYGGLLGPRSGDGNGVGSTVNALFGGDQAAFAAHEPLDIMKGASFPQLAGWFEVGSDDADPLAAQRELAPAARAAQIETCSVVVPGGEHTFQMWKQSFQDSLPWVAARLGITDDHPACPRD